MKRKTIFLLLVLLSISLSPRILDVSANSDSPSFIITITPSSQTAPADYWRRFTVTITSLIDQEQTITLSGYYEPHDWTPIVRFPDLPSKYVDTTYFDLSARETREIIMEATITQLMYIEDAPWTSNIWLLLSTSYSDYWVQMEIPFTIIKFWSCDSEGYQKNIFEVSDEVHVAGQLKPSGAFSDPDLVEEIYVVKDVTWVDGMAIPPRVPGTEIQIPLESPWKGIVRDEVVWYSPLTPGKYDIVVDMNGNGVYDAYLDALDDGDIDNSAGFLVPQTRLKANTRIQGFRIKIKHTPE